MPEDGELPTLQSILKRIAIVVAVILFLAIPFWLFKKTLTPNGYGNAISTIGLLAAALGSLSLLGPQGAKKEHSSLPGQATDWSGRFLRFIISLAENHLVPFTLILSGLLAIGIGWIVAVIFPPV